MSTRLRKLIVVSAIAAVLLIANTRVIACWLEDIGAIGCARSIHAEYLTGTAITVILAMIFLLGGTNPVVRIGKRCPVCDHAMQNPALYCGACGSRVG